ncbi:MAG TPA: glucuronate isomerase, partial [Flavisolibacter sp.]|nr:glucuronate isomerase [Flavisolibacter sp.]
MKTILHKNFLLQNGYGKRLYHAVAAALPIIDPHNHIDPAALSANKKFDNLYQLWIQHDPYKHRAMRICGVAEELITGSRSDYEKFLAWAECYPCTAGNPLFHWCAMELKEVFGIKKMLTADNAKAIWDEANKKLSKKGYGALDIVKKLGVEILCTSDDLLDSLEHHTALANQKNSVTCLPSLRSDSILLFQPSWMDRLQRATDIHINDLNTYKSAIINRLDFFDNNGCLLSDHSLDSGFRFIQTNEETAAAIFSQVVNGQALSDNEKTSLQSYVLHFLGIEYAKRNWKMQLHMGAHRYTSSVLREKLGPA